MRFRARLLPARTQPPKSGKTGKRRRARLYFSFFFSIFGGFYGIRLPTPIQFYSFNDRAFSYRRRAWEQKSRRRIRKNFFFRARRPNERLGNPSRCRVGKLSYQRRFAVYRTGQVSRFGGIFQKGRVAVRATAERVGGVFCEIGEPLRARFPFGEARLRRERTRSYAKFFTRCVKFLAKLSALCYTNTVRPVVCRAPEQKNGIGQVIYEKGMVF